MFPIDGIVPTEIETIHPACADVLHYWQQRAEEVGGIPKLTDIDLMQLWEHASYITIKDTEVDPESAGLRFRWRYSGTMMHELTGYELTGRYLDDVFDATDETIDTQKHVARSGTPHYWRRSLQNTAVDWAPIPYECLSMPLTNSHGDIGHILCIVAWSEDHVNDAGSDLHSRQRLNSQMNPAGHLVSHAGTP